MKAWWTSIWPNLVIAACVLALVAVIEYMGELRGSYSARLACESDKTSAVAAEHQAYVKEVKRGSDAVAELRAQLDAAQLANDDLTRRLAHVPRFVSTPACPSPGDGQLTVAGLMRWNSALGYPGMPASACGVAGGATGPCAAGADEQLGQPAGVTVDQAQTNAEINFGRCKEIRTRCLALYEFLKSRPDGHAIKDIAP